MFLESSVRDVEMTPVMTSVPVKFAAAFSERPAISRFDCMSVHPALVSLRVCDLIRQLDRHKSFSDGVISSTTQTHSYSAHTLHILHLFLLQNAHIVTLVIGVSVGVLLFFMFFNWCRC